MLCVCVCREGGGRGGGEEEDEKGCFGVLYSLSGQEKKVNQGDVCKIFLVKSKLLV